jgi:hypothetical protein
MEILIRTCRAAAILAAISVMAASFKSVAATPLEYAVKATYLAKFGLFIEWPKSVLDSAQSPIVLCVQGKDPFGETLNKAVEGQRINAHPLVMRRLNVVSPDSGCAILYTGGSEDQPVDAALAAVSGTGVLTVTDTDRASQGSGIINFVVENNRVRFTVDERAAAQNGVTISSHLLGLALSVRQRS